MLLFIAAVAGQCAHSGMYRLPVMTYLDTDTISAIAFESNIPNVDEEEYATKFLGSIFNEVNKILIRYRVQLYMSMKMPINGDESLDCTLASPLITFMKNIESKKPEKSNYNKLYILYCDNFYSYLSLKHGVYHNYDNCQTSIGIMYVNNIILRQKIIDALLEMVSRSKVRKIDIPFEKNLCRYINECVDGQINAVGEYANFLHFIDNL